MSGIGKDEINKADIDGLKEKFDIIQQKIIAVENYNDLKSLRDSLGPYYSLSIFADMAFSHTWKKLDLSASNDELEKRIQVMVAEILHLYPGAVLADLAIKIGSEPYRHCFGIYEGSPEKYQNNLKEYLTSYQSGLYAPHLLLLKEKTHGILNYEDGEETKIKKTASHKLCKLQISSFQEYENPDNLKEGEKEDKLDFPNFRDIVTKPTFEKGQNLCIDSFKILYFHGGCNTSYSLLNEEDGVFTQLFLTLKKDEEGQFYYPDDVALAILRSMNRLATVAALQKLQEQQRQLERESQMLEQLMEPLKQITTGLAQTTESAQRLRAVLYDPQQSIFDAASRVWRYFEEGDQVTIADEQVKIAHNRGAIRTLMGQEGFR